MLTQPYKLLIERRNPARNMARFYAISIEEDLFGRACLVRRWGRIGTGGRTRLEPFEREEEAVAAFLALLRTKLRRGYAPTPV